MKVYKNNDYSVGLGLYRMLVSIVIIKNILFYCIYYDAFFVYKIATPVGMQNAQVFQYVNTHPGVVLVILFFLSILFLLGIGGWLVGVGLFITLLITNRMLINALDGSDNVIHAVLPFLVLSNSYEKFIIFKQPNFVHGFVKYNYYHDIVVVVNKYFHIGLLVQVCFIYFFAAIAKLQGPLWQNGTAIYYIMRVDEFRQTDLVLYLIRNVYFVTAITYLTILWELAFGFLVWFKVTRTPILLMGIGMHLFIFLFMKIDNFSWVMIGSYFTFFENKSYERFFLFVIRTYRKYKFVHAHLLNKA